MNQRERGQTFVLGAVGIIAVVGMVALVIDAGFAFMARLELQKMADAAALAAIGEWVAYPDPQYPGESEAAWQTRMASTMQATAQQYADLNGAIATGLCASDSPPAVVVVLDPSQVPPDPVQIIALPVAPPSGTPVPMGEAPSLHVRATCGVPLIFGRILWQTGQAPTLGVQADATAIEGCRDKGGAVFAYTTPCPGPTPQPPTPGPRLGTRLIG